MMEQTNSFERVARFYDLFADDEQVEFFGQYAENFPVTLDVGAGTGRLTLALAERGQHVIAVEPSPAMRREMERKLSKRPHLWENVAIHDGTAGSFRLRKQYGLAVMSGSLPFLLTHEVRRAAMQNVASHIYSGGKLVLDVPMDAMTECEQTAAGVVKQGKRQYRRFISRAQRGDGQMIVTLLFEVYEGKELLERVEQQHTSAILTREGVHTALHEAGFNVAAEFSDYGFTPYEEGAPVLVVDATRR